MKSRNDRYSDSRNIERENYFVVIKRDPSVTCPARYDRPRGGGAQLTFLSRVNTESTMAVVYSISRPTFFVFVCVKSATLTEAPQAGL